MKLEQVNKLAERPENQVKSNKRRPAVEAIPSQRDLSDLLQNSGLRYATEIRSDRPDISKSEVRSARFFSGDLPQRSTGIKSGLKSLDVYFGGEIPCGAIVEWGVPFGKKGREVVIKWVATATTSSRHSMCLWIMGNRDTKLDVYPPAWAARGVSLKNIRFVKSQSPVKDLKPVFFESIFDLIVFDMPKNMSDEEMAFLAHQARKHRYIVFILRNWLLTSKRGNVRAKVRVNCWQRGKNMPILLKTVKGISQRQVMLTEDRHWYESIFEHSNLSH